MKTQWDLKGFFYDGSDDPRIMEDVNAYVNDVSAFVKKYEGNIAGLSKDDFLSYLGDISALGKGTEKLYMYISLSMSLNTQDQNLQKLYQKLMKINSDCEERMVFIQEEYKSIGYDGFMEMAGMNEFLKYKNYLVGQATSLKYLLSEEEETLLIKVGQAEEENLYEEFTTTFEFPFQGKILTQDEVREKRRSPIRSERGEAINSLASVFNNKERQVVLGNLYALVCKDNVFNMEVRGYDTVMSSRNESEELSNEVVDTLIDSVTAMYPHYHEFLEMKRRMLGLDAIKYHDVLASVGSVEGEKIPFEKGMNMFLDVLSEVDPKQREFVLSMANEGRISVYPHKEKTTGAYASYQSNQKEFMLLNWTDSMQDVTTLAHEAGHCMHGYLSKKQDALVYHTPLTLAETASIFNETLMFEAMLKEADEEQRDILVMTRLDDIFSTIFRQIAYIRFERKCHESFVNNEPMTYSDFNAAWTQEMRELLGPKVELDVKMVGSGWSSIPHIFHTPFYCYTYAIGNIISLNLVQQYKNSQDKDEFMKKYHEFLSAGGSERPEDLLMRIFGTKMDDEFYSIAQQHILSLMNMVKENHPA